MKKHPEQNEQFEAQLRNLPDTVNQSLAFLGMKVDYFTRVKAAYLLDLLAGHFGDTRGLALLDVGCGVGNYHPLVRDRLGAMAGADVSASCIEQAAQQPDELVARKVFDFVGMDREHPSLLS